MPNYRLVDLNCWCGGCPRYGSKKSKVVECMRSGLKSEISLICQECHLDTSNFETSTARGHVIDVNKRAVMAMGNIGCGFAALEKLCASLNMPCTSSRTFNNKAMKSNVNDLLFNWQNEAAATIGKAYEELDPSNFKKEIINIDLTYDGT